MNKYLEKLASLGPIKKYFGHLTGRTVGNMDRDIDAIHRFQTQGKTLAGLKAEREGLATSRFKTRRNTGIAAAGLGGVGAYAYKRKKDAQNAETKEYLDQYFNKTASAASAGAELGGSILHTVGKGLSRIGSGALNVMNTAASGKFNRYYEQRGIHAGSDAYKAVTRAPTLHERVQAIYTKQNPKGFIHNKEDIAQNISNLQEQQRDARIAVGSTLTAAGLAYAHHVRNKIEQENQMQRY